MKTGAVAVVVLTAASAGACTSDRAPKPAPAPAPGAVALEEEDFRREPSRVRGAVFTADGRLEPPRDYRSWVFLTSGFDMAYGPAAAAMRASGAPAMDNVWVGRAAHDAFVASGVWPEGTMFVLEIRTGEGSGSIVNGGHYQTDLLAIEAAVKDSARFGALGGWGYFVFEVDDVGPSAPAKLLPATQACYACHGKHGAVEQTFTQFYPTLFPVAKARGTVRADFVGLPASSADVVAAVAGRGWEAGAQLLEETAAKWPHASVLGEAALNRAGYRMLAAKQTEGALALFAHVTERFPHSANAWDSLAEALEGAGKTAEALAANARGLAALPGDTTLDERRRALLVKALGERKARLAGI